MSPLVLTRKFGESVFVRHAASGDFVEIRIEQREHGPWSAIKLVFGEGSRFTIHRDREYAERRNTHTHGGPMLTETPPTEPPPSGPTPPIPTPGPQQPDPHPIQPLDEPPNG